MYVQKWRIELRGNSGHPYNEPVLALILQLRCQVCTNECEIYYARTISPLIVREGNSGRFNGGSSVADASSWFGFIVKERLAIQRSCDECGTVSVIPPRQQKALIVASNSAMSPTWLRKAVAGFNFEIKTIPATADYWPREVYVAKDGITAMDWVSFEPASV